MDVIDKTDGISAEKSEDEIRFMITNSSGGFCIMSSYPKSRFEGVFFREKGKLYKAIELLRINRPVTKIVNNLWQVERHREELTESFFMPMYSNTLIYELSRKAEFDLLLDCRLIYDNREWGRIYSVSKEAGCLLVKFSKKNDSRDSQTDEKQEFDIYVAAYSDNLEFRKNDTWEKMFYETDKERNSMPFERFAYNACSLRGMGAAFAFSTDKREALNEAKCAWKSREKLKSEKEKHVSSIVHRKKLKGTEEDVAYQCALNAIDSMKVNELGISAGLPWFYQFWARDELISLKALINMGQYDFAKKIIFKYLSMIGEDGKIESQDGSRGLKSCDAPFWVFKRAEDLIDALKKEGKLARHFSKQDVNTLRQKLEDTVKSWIDKNMKDGLAVNMPLETWMDTDYKGDDRSGARIEMQALFLSAMRLLRSMGVVAGTEAEVRESARKMFWNGEMLSDGALDPTARPNVFIAAYVYPELLSPKEWKKCFDTVLPKLWLSWGGLSTIDKKSQLYCSNDTGENTQSYHRGNSWFWINNIAAIALHRTDAKRYQKYINSIVEASSKEMLYLGVAGYASELSSAAELKSQGCFAQAWSAATFVELMDEIKH